MMFKMLLVLAVCASNVESSYLPSHVCPCGWSKILDGCYMFVKKKEPWDAARLTCVSKGGVLAIPTSYTDSVYLSNEASSAGLAAPWIGVRRGYFWSSGFYDVCRKALGAVRWAHNQPDNWGGNEKCVEMLLDQGRRGQLNDIKCDHRKGFICQYKEKGC